MRIFDIGPSVTELRRKVGAEEPIVLDGNGVTSVALTVELLYDVTHCDHPISIPHGYNENGQKVWLITGDIIPAEPGDELAYMALIQTARSGRLLQAYLVTEPEPSSGMLLPSSSLFAKFSTAAASEFTRTARSY